jgi:hypothetical protein
MPDHLEQLVCGLTNLGTAGTQGNIRAEVSTLAAYDKPSRIGATNAAAPSTNSDRLTFRTVRKASCMARLLVVRTKA